ncbi:MAG: nucleotidyl transferase AbiEii/AbiGii toxin family protein [Pseudomonadota bacterium]
MLDSKAHLLSQARQEQFKPENLEKVMQLLEVLKAFMTVPYLKDRLALKGGTALNLFHFESLPRLSVDIDLNYIGSIDKSIMLEERPVINRAIEQILSDMGMTAYRNPTTYAGGKMIWQYKSLLGQKGNLEIDLNYMYRQPLLDLEWKLPNLTREGSIEVPVLDVHELASGKLAALFNRRTSRDFFDAHHLFTHGHLSLDQLRPIWVAYLAMSEVSQEALKLGHLNYDLKDIHNQLLPVLKQDSNIRARGNLENWAQEMLEALRKSLSILLPLRSSEEKFLQSIRTDGKIEPQLITGDRSLIDKLKGHPALLWATSKAKSLA